MSFQSQIIAIGKMKNSSPFLGAYTEYEKRLKKSVELIELDGKDTKEERDKITAKLNINSPIIALDELGKTLSSVELSKKITDLQNIKPGKVQFIIGGADGLDDDIRQRADFGVELWAPDMAAYAGAGYVD